MNASTYVIHCSLNWIYMSLDLCLIEKHTKRKEKNKDRKNQEGSDLRKTQNLEFRFISQK